MTKPIRCVLRILSPVHVGCDEVYEPMAFTLDEEGCKLIAFDPLEFFKHLSLAEKDSFAAICGKGTMASILEIYRFMRKKRASGQEVQVSSGLVEHYRKTVSLSPVDSRKLEQELNRFSISRTSHTAVSQMPYLPGSAIKGALRTACLNSRASDRTTPQRHRGTAARDLEKGLLEGGSFETDPFRFLKVSDFMALGNVKTRILYAVNRKKKPSKFEARGPYQILEIIEPGSLFEGWITVLKPEKTAQIRRPLTIESLLASTAAFYSGEWERETGELAVIGAEPPQATFRSDEHLIRLGRHSGAECLTIAGHRNIRIMQGKGQQPKFSSQATTLWLAAESDKPRDNTGLRTFGWAGLREASEEEISQLEEARARRASALPEIEETREAQFLGRGPEYDTPRVLAERTEPCREVKLEIWDRAVITWRPNDQTIIASFGNRKAQTKGRDLIPEALAEKVFGKKKKPVTAKVHVESMGRDSYRIIKIETQP